MQHKWTSEVQQSRVCLSDSFTPFTPGFCCSDKCTENIIFSTRSCVISLSMPQSAHSLWKHQVHRLKKKKNTEKRLKIRNHSTTGSLQHYDSLPPHSAQHWENEGNLWEPSMQRGRVRDAVTAHFTSVNTHSTQHALTDPLKLSLFLNLP